MTLEVGGQGRVMHVLHERYIVKELVITPP